MRSKPARRASATRRSLWLQDRSPPVRLISPNTAAPAGSGVSRCAEAIASATARSAAGSSMRIPPAIVTKMSEDDNLSPACLPRTATSIARRLRSKPTATRRGMASSVWLTSAWTSTRKQRVPSTATCTAEPAAGAASLEEQGGGVGHRLQARPRHLEDPELVGGAEAVLDGAQRAVEAVAVALELEHRVDHVLEHPGAGDRALLGDVTRRGRRRRRCPWPGGGSGPPPRAPGSRCPAPM